MIERDYIMRMIDMLAKVLARAIFLKKSQEYPKAVEELASACRNLLGLDRDVISLIDDEQLIALLNADEDMGGSKCYVLGMLLKEEAAIESARGNNKDAIALLEKSLGLLTEAFLRADGSVVPAHLPAINELVGLLGAADFPVRTLDRLIHFYEKTGRFDKAEDILFDLLDRDPDSVSRGLAFYARLLKKEDSLLEKGNLPRAEIEEAIEELHARLGKA
jgi:tetratricopeptide (TPR) repeat protein